MPEEISKKRIQKFWKSVGLHHYPDCECINGKGICWGLSSETYGKNGHWHFVLPLVTGYEALAPLFQYAVPKLHAWTVGSTPDGNICAVAVLKKDVRGEACDKDPGTALFLALEKVLEN